MGLKLEGDLLKIGLAPLTLVTAPRSGNRAVAD